MSTSESYFEDWTLLEFSESAESAHVFQLFGVPDNEIMRREILLLYTRAFLVILALHGEKATLQDNYPFLNYLVSSPIGMSLSFHAEIARKSQSKWKVFSESTRFEGFVHAAVAYQIHHGFIGDSTPEETVLEITRRGEVVERGTIAAVLAEAAKRHLPTPGTIAFEDFSIELNKAIEARKRRERRGHTVRCRSPYMGIILKDFLANALWCRTTADIVSEYFSDSIGDDHERHESAFNRAFSNLKLSKGRRSHIPKCPDITG